MKIELVVFDMAGTTVHDGDAVNVCLRRALTEAQVEASRTEVNAVMGEPKPVAIAKLLTRTRQAFVGTHDPEVVDIHTRFEALMIDHYRHDSGVRPVAGAVEVFRQLSDRGIKVALDTGFSRTIADAILERLGWLTGNLVAATVASDEVPRGRPDPDLIQRAMLLTSVTNVASVAKVGDTPADLLSGTAAGCGWVIGITTGSHTRAELLPFAHTHLIDELPEVLQVVEAECQVDH